MNEHAGTAVVVTHDRELVEAADVVWHLAGGVVVEAGPPEALLLRDGPTARLFTVAPTRPVAAG